MYSISPDLLILGFIAGVILFRLYSILGKKDDDNIDLAQFKDNNFNAMVDISNQAQAEDIIDLAEAEKDLVKGFESVVEQIRTIDPKFSLKKFLEGAQKAFEMILTAFAENDRETLNLLLDDKVFVQFSSEIDKRIKNSIKLDLTLVAIPLIKIKNIYLKGSLVSIEVIYNSQQITLLKNEAGNIIEGNSSQIDNVEDLWVFSKKLNTKSNWLLVQVNAS